MIDSPEVLRERKAKLERYLHKQSAQMERYHEIAYVLGEAKAREWLDQQPTIEPEPGI